MLTLALLSASAATAVAQTAPAGPSVSGAWSRPGMQGGTGVFYMAIMGGSQDDRLLGVTATIAARTELHLTTKDSAVMRMRPIGAIDVPAGQIVRLAPGGYHAMLIDLKRSLVPGDSVPLTLTFEKAGTVETTATVRKGGDPADDMSGMSPSEGQPDRR